MEWHSLAYSEVMNKLNVDKDSGLSQVDIKRLENKYGKNALKEAPTPTFLKRFLSQFSDFMVLILLAASAVSFITAIIEGNKSYADPIIILFIVVFNSIIGAIQESKAEKAISSLKKLSAPYAKVIRGGIQISIPAEKVLPGDIICVSGGDFIPADARIIESHDLLVEESSLTGESHAIKKNAKATLPVNTPLAEQKNMLFSSSSVISGNAKAVVVETGMNTQVGKIANLINEGERPQTPLQEKLGKTGKTLGILIIVICFLIFILGMLHGLDPLEMFMLSISLAVAAIPEGLPAVVTIVLAIGVRKMAARNAIIRRLPSVETLGNATVICSDKTGTLTQNKMTVTEIRTSNGIENFDSDLSKKILEFSTLCNNSQIHKNNEENIIGMPTENALLLAAYKNGIDKTKLDKKYQRVKEYPFDSIKKTMTTIHKLPNGKYKVVSKGAPDLILKYCTHYLSNSGILPIDQKIINEIKNNNEKMTSKALRTLGVAYKEADVFPDESLSNCNLIFCGLVGMIDPPRPEAKVAVQECLNAGIKPVMITGDHPGTANAIASELGILSHGGKSITGQEIDALDENEFEKNIENYCVFSRVSPAHKVKIVKAFQSKGHVVAMTGDGVNDAPALKISDIGCAMGKSGTDVAKSASDIILTDDNFSTIVEAVRQGRGLFENIKKSIHFLLSTNVGEIVAVFIAFILKLPSPLIAIQLLWINLVTDSFPALALGVDPIDNDIMKRKPNFGEKRLFCPKLWYCIVIEGCFIGAISLLAFSIGKVFFDYPHSFVVARTMAFTVLGLSQIVHSFNVRSEKPLKKESFFDNKYLIYAFFLCAFLQISVVTIPNLCDLFKTQQMNFIQWVIVLMLASSPLLISELEKHIIFLLDKTKAKFKFSKKA